MNQTHSSHDRLVNAVGSHLQGFLSGEIGLEVRPPEPQQEDMQRLRLGYLTSIVSVEEDVSTLIACSFERGLIEQIFRIYAEGVEVADDEQEAMIEETAAEVINVVVGNAMADIQTPGKAIGLSPPVVLSEAKSLTRHRDAQFSSFRLHTSAGLMSVHFLCPREAVAADLTLELPATTQSNR
ncbi:chemotaxis protein CheX [Magnetovirga frankeli]|uniref:chemotaxis protein CheX n=1 Tax=Magnetovirga frankeli TaxID=947516 RepID=UPI001293252B|nr:chemotaxis protein CheX [gamma proteobacterium SS-5]